MAKYLKSTASSIAIFLTPGFQVCTRNGEEGLNVETPTQSFENYQLDTALIEKGMF